MIVIDRPSVAEVLPLAEEIWDHANGACCLHIVLEDLNLEDRHVQFCCCLALERDHQDCFDLGMSLRRMTRSQRGRLAKRL